MATFDGGISSHTHGIGTVDNYFWEHSRPGAIHANLADSGVAVKPNSDHLQSYRVSGHRTNLLTHVADTQPGDTPTGKTPNLNLGELTVNEIRIYGARQNAPDFNEGQLRFYIEINSNKVDEFQRKALQKQTELLTLATRNRDEFEDAKTDALKSALELVFSPNIKSLASFVASLSNIVLKGQVTAEEQALFDEMVNLRKTEQSYRDVVNVYLQELDSRGK